MNYEARRLVLWLADLNIHAFLADLAGDTWKVDLSEVLSEYRYASTVNMVRAAASDASVVPADDTDFGIYGGTRSGEAPSGYVPIGLGMGEHAGILSNSRRGSRSARTR